MGSTVRSSNWSQTRELGNGSLRWRNWPLADRPQWSWILLGSIVLVGFGVYSIGDSIVMALAAIACLVVSLWNFLLPSTFEVTSLGIRRRALGRVRLFPWQAVRAYQFRPTGALLFQRPDPMPIDVLSSLFVPFPADGDELIVALRLYLPHAVEVPTDFGPTDAAAGQSMSSDIVP